MERRAGHHDRLRARPVLPDGERPARPDGLVPVARPGPERACANAYSDDNGNIHEPNINLVAREGIASGCAAGKYCPTALVARDQMASFLSRALELGGAAPNAFTDDSGNIHEPNINLVARDGIASGCGGGKYCPTAKVTRGQMAAFLHRAFD